ncbi:uncharacterized protein [Mytilus edulis]|uniref:uncharacterized protein n=1 Tax=Mytilus edulis TaxID=6550 RepID=UPI0039F0B5CA
MATCSKDPRPTCSKENQNYVTLDKLLKEVSEPVVRKRFDKEFDPAVLQATLNKESVKIKKHTNRRQWNILFPPRDQKPVCSSDFDLTLMILLIRNLTPIQISDILPVPNDTNQGADLSRIKDCRNKLAHCNGSISDIEFETQWMEVSQAIVRLGGESYKEICSQLKVTSLSSGKGYGMKNIHNEIIQDWEKIEMKIVETNAIQELMKMVKKSNFVAIIGPSGCGKSTAAHHVALSLQRNEGYQIIPSHFPTDIIHYYDGSEKQVFVYDDVCGKYSIDYDIRKQWKTLSIELLKIKQCENVKILVSSRSDIFCQFQDVQVLSAPKLDMLSNEYNLCDDERFLIAKAHVGLEKAETLRKANFFNRYDFFPLLCQIFDTKKDRNIENFFSQPEDFIREELTSLKEEKDQTSFAVLALFVIYNNCITDEIMSPTSGIKTILSDIAEECELSTLLNIKVVRKHLKMFLHSYVKKIGSSYMIMHDKLFDIFVSFYGEHLLDIVLTHCIYPVIFTRFQLQSVEDTDECMIKVPVGKEAKYIQRLFHVSDSGDFAKIFWHSQLKYRTFRQHFLQFLSEDQVCCNMCLSLSDAECSPLIISAARGHTEIVQVLVDMGMNVNAKFKFHGLTPLAYAGAGGRLETFKILYENDAAIKDNIDLLCFTLAKGVVDMLFTMSLFFDLYFENSIDMEQNKRERDYTEIASILIENDVKFINVELRYERTPVYLATVFGHTDIVKSLLKRNYDMNQYDIFHLTPLYVATLCKNLEIVEILLAHQCDTNICNEENESPLYAASKWGHVDILKLLSLDNNCDVNICNEKRESPLHVASKCIGCNMCDVDKFDFENYLHECHNLPHNYQKSKCYGCILGINSQPASTIGEHCERRLQGLHDFTPVSKDDYVEIVKVLLMRNADVNICNIDGKTPIEVALENGNAKIVELLSEHSTVQLL